MVAVTPRRRLAAASLALGLLVAVLARLADPTAPPLYDGVIVIEPYVWLEPPPGERGGAQGAADTVPLEDGRSPLLALATPEQPPQAQLFAPPGALMLPPGTASLSLSIAPIPPAGAPANGHVAGNVYRIGVTNQDGVAATAPADAFVTVVLRGPEEVAVATISRFKDGVWVPLATSHAGYTSGYLAVVTEFGDFALVAPGAGPSPAGPGPTPDGPSVPGGPLDTAALLAIAAVTAGLAALAFAAYRSRAKRRTPPRVPRRRRR